MIRSLIVNGTLFLSLGLDTLGVAVGLGISGLPGRQRLRIGLAFALAEGGMPLIGFVLGAVLAASASQLAAYLAIALLFAVGLFAIWEALHGERHGFKAVSLGALILLALSVSMDELAVGFSIGLLRVPVALAISYMAAQALVITLVGTAIGKRVGELFAQRAGLVSGIALSLLAALLLAENLAPL